jgi:hypothetical protein
MRTMLMSAAALGLVATLLTGPAQADRMCRKVCHDGFCKSECVSSGPRLYMHGVIATIIIGVTCTDRA